MQACLVACLVAYLNVGEITRTVGIAFRGGIRVTKHRSCTALLLLLASAVAFVCCLLLLVAWCLFSGSLLLLPSTVVFLLVSI